jgi:hypothetical protein
MSDALNAPQKNKIRTEVANAPLGRLAHKGNRGSAARHKKFRLRQPLPA